MHKLLKPSIYWLLLSAPLALILEETHAPAPLVFFSAALAIVPIASLIVLSTEHLASHLGPAAGGLLSATCGNLPELIIAVVALRAGLTDMVRASITGALLANLLLAMGLAFLLGGIRHHVQEYNPAAGRTYGAMMLLAALSITVPAGFRRVVGEQGIRYAEMLDVGVAIAFLAAYVLYLIFMLRTHRDFFTETAEENEHGAGAVWSAGKAGGVLLGASLAAAWMSEILVGAAEATGHALGMSPVFVGVVLLAVVGGAAESGSAVSMARRNKMGLSVGIVMGSCIQTALFVAPVLVIASRLAGMKPFALNFTPGEILTLFAAVLIGLSAAGDGRANWFKGVQLLVFYLILATMFYLVPPETGWQKP